jgi:molecular chaperone DnaJ
MAKDYYALLGIPRDATADQIKSAYRRQAKRVHPDACIGRKASAGRDTPAGQDASGEPDAGGDRECFQDVQEAYETLNDPERRRAYDRRTAPRPRPRPEPLWTRVEPLRSRPRTSSPFETLAGEPLPQQRATRERRSAPEPLVPPSSPLEPEPLIPLARPQGPRLGSVGGDRVEQLYAEIPLTLDQAERGGRVDLWVPLQIACPECRGWGGWGFDVCPRCAGRGRIADERPLFLSFPGGIVDGQVARLSLEQAGMPGVVLTVRFSVDEW